MSLLISRSLVSSRSLQQAERLFFSPTHLLPLVLGTATWYPAWTALLAPHDQALRPSGGLISHLQSRTLDIKEV